jgi:uncharacterized membrane protein (UPF0127 family)
VVVLLQFCPANRRQAVWTLKTSGDALLIEVADSPERRLFALGMLDRFQPGRGVLLIFDDGTPPRVWSKALQVEADLLWLDETRQIVDRDVGVGPCAVDPCPEYTPERGAVSVLVLPPASGQDAAFALGQTAFLRPATP